MPLEQKRKFENVFLKINSFSEKNIWYEPIPQEELWEKGFSSFRIHNPIQFDKDLEISVLFQDDSFSGAVEFNSVVYWYM